MRAVTRAAEGFDRRAFTVSEVLRMQEAGIISQDENFELIEFKAALYARHKIQEYWVVDAAARRAFQFAGPRSKSWRRRIERGPDEVLTHPALPGFSIRLSDY